MKTPRTLAENVAALMELRGWNSRELARRIKGEGAANVERQHIEQLIKGSTATPRYMKQLAAAFGMSRDELEEWRPGLPTDPKALGPAANQEETLAESLLVIRSALLSIAVAGASRNLEYGEDLAQSFSQLVPQHLLAPESFGEKFLTGVDRAVANARRKRLNRHSK